MRLHEKQREIAQSDARFKIIRAGRRSGKTTYEIESLVYNAVQKDGNVVFYIAPTQTQARSIIWEALKGRIAGIGETNEQRLEVKVPTQDGGIAIIKVAGWENRENFRGQFAHHITFDETDTMRDFFIGLSEIFRPAIIDTGGSIDFIGTPKKENPNLKRLEKEAENDSNSNDWESFHFTSWDNPVLKKHELEKSKEDLDAETYKQEIMAEYVENSGALFRYTSLVDMFSNTIVKEDRKYLVVDIADDGSDKTVYTFWQGQELFRIEKFDRSNTETIISQIRDYAKTDRIPYSNVCVDAIGVGAGVASASLLDGIIGFKSSHAAMRTDQDPVRLPNVHYLKDAPLITEYKNLRSQCVFTLADLVNNHKIAVSVDDARLKQEIIDELSLYQDVTKDGQKRIVTPKDDIKALLGRSPDVSDALIMRQFFTIRDRLQPDQSEEQERIHNELISQFEKNAGNLARSSSR